MQGPSAAGLYPPRVHETRLRVRFDEVDSMQVVHHPRYLVWFEVARTEAFRALGVPYRDVMESGTHLAVVEAGLRFLRAARYDEEVVVETRCTAVGGATVTFEYVARREGEVLATGFTRLGSIEPQGGPKRMPQEMRARFASVLEAPAQDRVPPGVQRGA